MQKAMAFIGGFIGWILLHKIFEVVILYIAAHPLINSLFFRINIENPIEQFFIAFGTNIASICIAFIIASKIDKTILEKQFVIILAILSTIIYSIVSFFLWKFSESISKEAIISSISYTFGIFLSFLSYYYSSAKLGGSKGG